MWDLFDVIIGFIFLIGVGVYLYWVWSFNFEFGVLFFEKMLVYRDCIVYVCWDIGSCFWIFF